MNTMKHLLENKVMDVKKPARKRNVAWEEAEEFAKRMGVSSPFVMKLFKSYGKAKVKAQLSYISDLPLTSNRYAGLIFNLKRHSLTKV